MGVANRKLFLGLKYYLRFTVISYDCIELTIDLNSFLAYSFTRKK